MCFILRHLSEILENLLFEIAPVYDYLNISGKRILSGVFAFFMKAGA